MYTPLKTSFLLAKVKYFCTQLWTKKFYSFEIVSVDFNLIKSHHSNYPSCLLVSFPRVMTWFLIWICYLLGEFPSRCLCAKCPQWFAHFFLFTYPVFEHENQVNTGINLLALVWFGNHLKNQVKLAHNMKNQVIQRNFVQFGKIISYHFSLVLLVVLRMYDMLLKKPQPVINACTNSSWKCFEVGFLKYTSCFTYHKVLLLIHNFFNTAEFPWGIEWDLHKGERDDNWSTEV